MENTCYRILGIDIGSVSIGTVLMDSDHTLLSRDYRFHNGNITETLNAVLSDIKATDPVYVAVTSCSPSYTARTREYDQLVSTIRACKYFHQNFGAVLNVGGEKFNLSLFDDSMSYSGSRHNTSCAAGTGSFLDQQAVRLGLDSSKELSLEALSNTQSVPDIATRCAVFAKTDLIHAQQEGFSIPQICDGLCKGLAKNIHNTLFSGPSVPSPIIFCGGVSRNLCVQNHIESLLQRELVVDEQSHMYGAAGAALCLLDDMEENFSGDFTPFRPVDLSQIFEIGPARKKLFYPPLTLELSTYPNFDARHSVISDGVETDLYLDTEKMRSFSCYIGIDVGSTSTKSVILTDEGEVLAGFYTKTASKPVKAVQSILRAMDRLTDEHRLDLHVKGCGTTGSGRKLSGKIIGADIMPDEITAHARAAVEINADVDTIIEIGGQDAKFTTLKDGNVTSSVMNSICAAGTGSFIEEQAYKLDCPLSEYSDKTESAGSPLSSDRCTVFMERDMNYFLATGYQTNEVLASALHSVRDNYLSKVASMGKIGNTILFQGATARNKALVAAFEQKIQKPIHVSGYCHLTGALGIALMLKDLTTDSGRFRGFDLHKKEIPVRQETCRLCTNHCKLTIADIDGTVEAFGFLCGRDLQTDRYVSKEQGFNLIKERRKATCKADTSEIKESFTIGIPDALHLVEDLDFWQNFFTCLNVKTITSRNLKTPVETGRFMAGAEFCTPILSLHGHVAHLSKKADYLFLPFYFEEQKRERKARRQYCYYTQFAPSVISTLPEIEENRLISPLIQYLYSTFHTKIELYKSLKKITQQDFSFLDISSAWDRAAELKDKTKQNLHDLLHDRKSTTDINALLLGRPYTILSKTLNCGIPDIFSSLDVNVFYQDMLDFSEYDFSGIDGLLREIHWRHAAHILKAAYIAAKTEHVYPVYITSFNCSPDSFCIDYFRQIMEAHDKPYLILELDEHDSNVGYETRIEAAIRAFRNHRNYFSKREDTASAASDAHQISRQTPPLSVNPDLTDRIGNKTIIFPNWDAITGRLLVAVLRSEGYNAFLMEETDETLKESLKTNTGQCIPLNAIASGFIHTVKKYGLDPSDCVLWLSKAEISCNIKLYPHHIKTILNRNGNGFEHSNVYVGELSFIDISFKSSINSYFAYMFGGLIRSIGCRIRPYEIHKGETDAAIENSLTLLEHTFKDNLPKEEALSKMMSDFTGIETRDEKRPKIAIFGDLYMRDNAVINQDLIHFIEDNGGEVITTPYYKFVKMIASSYFKKWFKEGRYFSLISNKALFAAMTRLEKKYYKYFNPLLNETEIDFDDNPEEILQEYGLLPEHTGESMDNLLKIHYVVKEHPDISLFVQTSPSFCCPSLITEAMGHTIERKTGVPIVGITYDISGGNKNRILIPFLKFTQPHAGHPQILKESV
mgnify:CR=1 FL=1